MPKLTKSGNQSDSWKCLERKISKDLKLKGFKSARRIVRTDKSQSIHDVDALKEMPDVVIDCKYRQSHAHHTLFRDCAEKYTDNGKLNLVIISKVAGESGELAIIDWQYLLRLFATAYLGQSHTISGLVCPKCTAVVGLEVETSKVAVYKCAHCEYEFTTCK